MKEIKISNGIIFIKEAKSRKTQREYNFALYDGITTTNREEGLSLSSLDRAKDFLVLNMISKAVIEEKEVEVNMEFVENLLDDDFNELIDFINDQDEKTEQSKKK